MAEVRVFWPQKLLHFDHVLATAEKSCANKEIHFSQINISLLANFECFLEENAFLDKKIFRPNVKTAVFSVIPAGTRSVVIVARTVPLSFVD